MSLDSSLTEASARTALFDGLSYQGFSTKAFRELLVTKGWTHEDVIRALVVYISCGANPGNPKRRDKVAKPEVLKLQINWLATKSVVSHTTSAEGITLGRIAKAYAPVLLLLRIELKDKLRLQVRSDSPIEQCDIAFLGLSSTVWLSASADFCEKMGVIITRAGFPRMSDEEIRDRNAGFASAAEAGLITDSSLSEVLNSNKPGSPGVTIESTMRQLHLL